MENTVAGHPQAYRTLDHKWPDNTITWSFADLIINSDPRQSEIGSSFLRDGSDGMRGLVRDAFDAWEAVCGVDFVEVGDSADSDIRIGWTAPAHSDGAGGTLAYYRPWTWIGTSTTSSGLIVVDHADSGVSLADVYDTVLHEVGHALGLDHSDVANVVMSGGLYSGGGPTPYWGGVPGRDPLQPDDIAGAVALWGPADGGSPPPPSGGATSGNDTLFGTQGADSMDGGAGNDVLYGLRGDDTLRGGSGNDTLSGGLNRAEDGANESTGGRNVLDGGPGNDHMSAGNSGTGLSTWTPAAGSDTFIFRPGHGHDTVAGNWGTRLGQEFHGAPEKIDLSAFGEDAPTWAEVAENLSVVRAQGAGGTWASSVRLDLTDFGGGSITFWNEGIATIDASDFIGLSTGRQPEPAGPGPDTLVGTEGPDTLEGLGGNDAMLGGAGNDRLVGGPGDDQMWGQGGDDTLIGGSGSDLMFGLDGDDYAEGGSQRDIFLGGTGNDELRGEGGDDGLWGEAGRDTIDGGAGADFVAGGTGDDSLRGGSGNDYLAGEEGDDVLNGDGGYDILAGGIGNDRLIGGDEGDTFFGQAGADTFVIAGGVSWIMDFEPGIDRIEVPGMDDAGFRAAASQLGDHLHVAFEGGDLYLAWTTLAGLEGVDLLA